MSAPEFNNPATVSPPVGAYSHAGWAKAGSDILFIAGQVGLRPNGTLPETLVEQADEAFANIARILAANGLSPANLVKLNAYLSQGLPAAPVREARRKHFGEIRPASTLVYVPQLVEAKYLIEIEGVAVR